MGWTSHHATFYKNGKVDRKAECDAYFDQPGYEVVKSAMVGSVYYAAIRTTRKIVYDENDKPLMNEDGSYVREDIPVFEQPVWAAVFLTSTRIDDDPYFNFSYKDLDESMKPCECDCPVSILDLLTEPSNEWARQWREECRARAKAKKEGNWLDKLPVGSKVRFTGNGQDIILTKHAPAFQFKTWFWYDEENNRYMKKKFVTSETAVAV